MPLQKLALKPGLNREGTSYSNEGGWYDGDKIRFRSGLPEKIGGWTQVSPSTFLGYCRSLWNWVDLSGNNFIGVGTTSKYYIYNGGTYNDITPIYYTSTLGTNPIASTASSTLVTITDTAYNPAVGDYLLFSSAVTVGGAVISGEYIVTSVPSATTYTIVIASAASSTTTGGTGAIIQYELPVGSAIYSIGTGWGEGPWGGVSSSLSVSLSNNPFATTSGSGVVVVSQPAHGLTAGTYISISGATSITGSSIYAGALNSTYTITASLTASTYSITLPFNAISTTTGGGANVKVQEQSGTRGWGTAYNSGGVGSQIRLWTNDNFGQDLVIAPRGGGIYYWQDANGVGTRAVSLSSLANSTASTIQTVSFASGAGSVVVSSPTGIYPYAYVTGTGIAAGTQVASTYIIGNTTVSLTANTIASSAGTNLTFSYSGQYVPTATNQIITSAIQEFVIAFGANSYNGGTYSSTFNPMLVRWSDQANAYQWVPQVTNQSGEFALSNGSFIMGARATRQEILVWTNTALYTMQYIGYPYVWSFQLLMDNISVISPNCMVTVNNRTFWMGTSKFYMYDGTVHTLPCSLRQYIFDDINLNQSFQVFAGANEGFNEVWWFYVSNESSGNAVDKYVIYNYLDNAWTYGNMARTAWLQTNIQSNPVAADYNSRLLYHESGVDDVSTSSPQPIYAYIQSSDFGVQAQDSSAGQHYGFVWRMLPDVNFNGSNVANPQVTIQLLPRQNSGTAYGTSDLNPVISTQTYASPTPQEYTIQQFTGQVYTRLRGRQMSFKIYSNTLGVAWQLGTPRFDVKPDGKRG
jgi:hypothetical protein